MHRSSFRRIAGATVAGLLLLGACSSGDDDEALDTDDAAETADDGTDDTTGDGETGGDENGDAEAGATSSVPATEGTDQAGAGGGAGTDPSEPPPTQAPTSQPPATDQPTEEQSQAVAAPTTPRAGTYTYERTTTNDEGTETEQSDAVVERLSGDDVNARLRIEQDSPQGPVTSTASAGPDGMVVEKSVIDSPLGQINCDWEPDWVFVGPYQAGSSWDVDTSCSDDTGTLQVTVAIEGTGTVVGVETITVRGRTLDAWVVETTLTTDVTIKTATATQTSSGDTTDRTWVDPANGMPVRSESTTNTSGDFGSGTSSETSELVAYSA